MTHSGQGDEPQHPAARPAHEGVVLPSDGSGPWIPGTAADQDRAVPTGGQPWGQPWGPQDGLQEQPGYGGGAPSAPQAQDVPQSYGQTYDQTYGQSYEPQQGGQPYGAPLPPAQGQPLQGHQVQGQPAAGQPYAPYQQYPQGQQLPPAQSQPLPQPLPPTQRHAQPLPLPAEAQAPGSADATQYLPPVPAMGDSDATQFIAPIPPGPGMLPPESSAEATQYLPSTAPPPQGSDADATQYIAPVPPQNVPAAPPGAPYGIRPGAPGDRQPPAEFDNLFRTDEPGGGQGAESTQQMPQFDAGRGPQPPQQPQQPQQRGPYGQQPAAYQQPPVRQGPVNGGRGTGRRKSSRAPLIAAVVVGCAVLGLGAGALMSSGGDSPQDDSKTVASEGSASAEPSTQTAPDPVKQQAEALDKLLADSNSSRSTVISAVEDIKSCDNLDQAATDLHGAAEQRRGLVTELEALTLDKLPNHTELTSSLTDAWQASASADDSYAQWAKQAKGKKGCKDGRARTTSQAAKANKASGEATAAKQKASGLWNSIATKYGLTEHAPTQL
ncbi:hypothetical protein ACIRQP_11325 [Streptomyces sp. NPDC102274]|uniref:hypothetical protein n=1 Tax=Streptomyces sp. NPDC102274 TaxID=3366151 RepID=UPI003823692D